MRYLLTLRRLLLAGFLLGASFALAAAPNYGVLAHLPAAAVAGFDARHSVLSVQLNPNRDLYLFTVANPATDTRTDAELLQEIEQDPVALRPELNEPMSLGGGFELNAQQSTASVLNGQSTASVLNGSGGTSTSSGSTSSGSGGLLGGLLNAIAGPNTLVGGLLNGVLNPLLGTVLNLNISVTGAGASVGQSSAAVLNSTPTDYYGAVVPQSYPNQPMVGQIHAGTQANQIATGQGAVVALIDNGVDPNNPVLQRVLLWQQGYNFYDNSHDWSAYSDLWDGPDGSAGLAGLSADQSTASVLKGQSTASVLNGSTPCAAEFSGIGPQATGSGLSGYQSTASVLNGEQSTASVLNGGQSTASVLNGEQSTASVLNTLGEILACDPDFGHGTSVAGLIHLVAPNTTILPIKAFGPGGTATAAVIYQSIAYAIDQHVNVMNLSFSASATTPDIQDIIAEAVNDGIVVVAAAGNGGTAAAVYPASLPGVTGAGALDGTQPGLPGASFSNFNPGVGQYVDVEAAAPGVNLFTTYPGTGQIWATVSGTSFSTPLIAGEAALLVQEGKSGAANQALIYRTANPSVLGDSSGGQGHGLINVYGALQAARPLLWLW